MRINCKSCRRLGESICGRLKCAFRRKPYPPGILESQRKHKSVRSEFGGHLMEKQKVRKSYGVSEKQFSNYVKSARAKKGSMSSTLLYEILERRLDNVVYRMGIAGSRSSARQMVSHGHITVNDKKVTVPSYSVVIGDVVAIREGSLGIGPFKNLKEKIDRQTSPAWINISSGGNKAKIVGKPATGDLAFNFNSVIEFYSR